MHAIFRLVERETQVSEVHFMLHDQRRITLRKMTAREFDGREYFIGWEVAVEQRSPDGTLHREAYRCQTTKDSDGSENFAFSRYFQLSRPSVVTNEDLLQIARNENFGQLLPTDILHGLDTLCAQITALLLELRLPEGAVTNA